jgi:hypothetical protein
MSQHIFIYIFLKSNPTHDEITSNKKKKKLVSGEL